MPSPCRKCGATKTEPVHRGFAGHLLPLLGYRLRQCSRCRRWRILRESVFSRQETQHGSDYGMEIPSMPDARDPSRPLQWATDPFDPDGFSGCPRCGGPAYERTRRNWLERNLGRPPMARCRTCRKRFPYPQA